MVASGAEVPYLGYDLVWGRGALDGSYGLVWGGDALVTFMVWGRCALDESYLLVWGGGALLGDVMVWGMGLDGSCLLVWGRGRPTWGRYGLGHRCSSWWESVSLHKSTLAHQYQGRLCCSSEATQMQPVHHTHTHRMNTKSYKRCLLFFVMMTMLWFWKKRKLRNR